MIKKLVPFFLCFVPMMSFGAFTCDTDPVTGVMLCAADPYSMVGSDGSILGINVNAAPVGITAGNGLIVGADGLNIDNNLYIGRDYNTGDTSSDMFVGIGTETNFSIVSGGGITIGNNLDVQMWRTLNISSASAMNVKNILNNGTLNIDAGDLTVSGGDYSNASLVNKGDFNALVMGNTHFEWGVDLSLMDTHNVFSLETDTLSLGGGISPDFWPYIFYNKLDLFKLVINNGGIFAQEIKNGEGNHQAIMHLKAQTVIADSIENYGRDLIIEANSSVNINGQIHNGYDSEMSIISGRDLNILDAITNDGVMTLQGRAVSMGAINSSGTLNFGFEWLDMSFLRNRGLATFVGSELTSDVIENDSGDITFVLRSGLLNAGDIINLSGKMNLYTDGIINIGGILNNSSPIGKLDIRAGYLYVNGNNGNTSFVNAGDFSAIVRSNTYFEGGFDLSLMDIHNVFYLETGTLNFGLGLMPDVLEQMFNNKLDSFRLVVNDGNIVAGDIQNGGGNSSANMYLKAQNVTANLVENYGRDLIIEADNSIRINGHVHGSNNSMTNMTSGGNLIVQGDVSNHGDMLLSGYDVNLSGIINYENLNILSSANGGKIQTLDVINYYGTLNIEGGEIDIKGILSNRNYSSMDSVTNIRGTGYDGSIRIGEIDSYNGVINIDALQGDVFVAGPINVSDWAGLNFGKNTKQVIARDRISFQGDLTLSPIEAGPNGGINVAGQDFKMISETGGIMVGGNIIATEQDYERSMLLDAQIIQISGDVIAGGQGHLIFGKDLTTHLNIYGALVSNEYAIVELNVDDIKVGSLSGNGTFIARGNGIDVTDGNNAAAIDIAGGLWLNANTVGDPGLYIENAFEFRLVTTGLYSGINIGGGITASGGTLILQSAGDLKIGENVLALNSELIIIANNNAKILGRVYNSSSGVFDLRANDISIGSYISNSGTMRLVSDTELSVGDGIDNYADISMSGTILTLGGIVSFDGSLEIVVSDALNMRYLNILGGWANITAENINITDTLQIVGNLMQGGTGETLNLLSDNIVLNAEDIMISGDFNAHSNKVTYNLEHNFTLTDNMNIESLATSLISAKRITTGDLNNYGVLSLKAQFVNLGNVINNGDLKIDSGASNYISFESLNLDSGTAVFKGIGFNAIEDVNIAGRLLQNYGDLSLLDADPLLLDGDLNIISDDYVILAKTFMASEINQETGKMLINTDVLNINGDIFAKDLLIKQNNPAGWLNVDVMGSVSGGVSFRGLESMSIGGNYTFDNDSSLIAAVLPSGSTSNNYWGTIGQEESNLGIIENAVGGKALITVGGEFITELSKPHSSGSFPLNNSQIGLNIFDVIDQGTAIWLVHAEGGLVQGQVQTELGTQISEKIRNLEMNFCNADGSLCYNYLDSFDVNNGEGEDLPIYLATYDSDGDGILDSVYVVFDPRFSGPVEIYKIQPVVDAENTHTQGEYSSAGALDNLLEGLLTKHKFNNKRPLELIPLIVEGTNLEMLGNELYDRMENYEMTKDKKILAKFSRLVQPRELELISGIIVQNEHTTFRDFEDRMFDEFIWNRHRNINKAWMDVDFGMFRQKGTDDKRMSGDRFSLSGGFDWQESATLILGLTGRVSHSKSDVYDDIDLSYKANEVVRGKVDANVSDTNFGVGAYLLQTINEKNRIYGNAFLDLHFLSVDKEMTFVNKIEGRGTAVSLITEWGYMHDWLNQYIVGNLYTRAGYNFGFSVAEKVSNYNYMDLESDGYFILTPGYSLTAQKRFYTSSWFQIRPNISAGVEYDLLGAPDKLNFKFSDATKLTGYEYDINPLWINGSVGVQLLSASGVQIGLDYRYQFNTDIQMHKIKLSASYRF